MVTGGQRSGKSAFAETMALMRSERPVYVATARVLDEEFRHRVDLHQQRRANRWTTLEEPLHVGDLTIPDGSVVLVDCMTLLATNWFLKLERVLKLHVTTLFQNLIRCFQGMPIS